MADTGHTKMEVFRGASKVRIERGNFSNVGGDQNNYTTIHAQKVILPDNGERKSIKWKRAKWLDVELSEYTSVKRGDIDKIQDIHCIRSWPRGEKDDEDDIYIAEINLGSFAGQAKKVTVKTFYGPLAEKRWRKEFMKFSGDRNVPLFGYNQSRIPSLIFHGELVPLAHFEDRLGKVGMYYVTLLNDCLRSDPSEMWLDTSKRMLGRGPVGPPCRRISYLRVEVDPLPFAAEFLDDSAILRYFSSIQRNFLFLGALSSTMDIKIRFVPEVSGRSYVHGPINSLLAASEKLCWRRYDPLYEPGEIMANDLTRFLLEDGQHCINLSLEERGTRWLSQALSIFHAHGISIDEDLSQYTLAYPQIQLRGALQKSKTKRRRRQVYPFIYIFLLPVYSFRLQQGSLTPFFHYWSFHEGGETPLSREMCRYLGLPVKLRLERLDSHELSWPTEVYKMMYEYQTACGFDPTTTDFAKYLGFIIFDVVPPETRFQDVSEEPTGFQLETNCSEASQEEPDSVNTLLRDLGEGHPDVHPEDFGDLLSLDLLFGDNFAQGSKTTMSEPDLPATVETEKEQRDTGGSMILSALFAPFTWEAVEGSDIPVVAI